MRSSKIKYINEVKIEQLWRLLKMAEYIVMDFSKEYRTVRLYYVGTGDALSNYPIVRYAKGPRRIHRPTYPLILDHG